MSKMKKDLRPGAPDKYPGRPLDHRFPPPTANDSRVPTDAQPRRPGSGKSEEQIDESLDESFPASDPPAHAVPTRPGPHRPAGK